MEAESPHRRITQPIPWICDGVDDSAVTLLDTVCYPFWGYHAMELAVLFIMLFLYRSCTHRFLMGVKMLYISDKMAGNGTLLQTGGNLVRLGVGDQSDPLWQRGDAEEPLLGDACKPNFEPAKSRRSQSFSCLGALSWAKVGTVRLCRTIILLVMQIFPWWLLMIGVLVISLLLESSEVFDRFGIRPSDRGVLAGGFTVLPELGDNVPGWLLTFSIYSWFAVAFIYVVSLFNIILQLLGHFTDRFISCRLLCIDLMVSLPRDIAIAVHLLPMVYSLLSAHSVSIVWSNMSGMYQPTLNCWNYSDAKKQKLQDSVYDTNFSLADMYEAWALFGFGQIVAKVMQPELQRKIRLDVFKSFESLLLIDVSVFVLVCGLGAVYSISLTWTSWRLGIDMCDEGHYPAACSIQSNLVGANWAVSSIAIYNLYTIETKFEHLSDMRQFHPRYKFWSIKLMVLVAFWATIFMAVIRDIWGLTDQQARLMDASFRIYVMAFISVLNVHAWKPLGGWYTVVDKVTDLEAEHLLLHPMPSTLEEVGVKHTPPGTNLLVRQLMPDVSKDDADDWEKVSEKIDNLTDAEVDKALHHGSQIGWCVRMRDRKVMIDWTANDRREALKEHLQGFYPEF